MDTRRGNKIKAARLAAGLSQAALASRAGLSTTSIRKYENGEPLRVDSAVRLQRVLRIQLTDLPLDDTTPPAPAEHPVRHERLVEIPTSGMLAEIARRDAEQEAALRMAREEIAHLRDMLARYDTIESTGDETASDEQPADATVTELRVASFRPADPTQRYAARSERPDLLDPPEPATDEPADAPTQTRRKPVQGRFAARSERPAETDPS